VLVACQYIRHSTFCIASSEGIYSLVVRVSRPNNLSLGSQIFIGMRVLRPSSDRYDSDPEGSPPPRRSFIQTALLLGSGVGMSVEPKSLQFLPMPISAVRPRDHKVVLAVLAHTADAVGIAKEFVGIDVVRGTLGAVQSLLIVVRVRSAFSELSKLLYAYISRR
jgi:hypothetical protein